MKHFPFTPLLFLILVNSAIPALSQDARAIMKKADDLMEGNSSHSVMVMTIVRPTWQRAVKFENWSKGREYAMTLILDPPKEKGQTFLKIRNDMWNWNPTINRMIKLPPSMLSQGWMGSDYTNDDILKESSVVNDYSHQIIGEEAIENYPCYKIELTPLEEAAVVWGKIILWISQKEYYQLRAEYFDEDGSLVKTHLLSEIKVMDDRRIPTHFEIIPADKPTQKTLVDIITMDFDIPIGDDFFSQQNMKAPK